MTTTTWPAPDPTTKTVHNVWPAPTTDPASTRSDLARLRWLAAYLVAAATAVR